MMNRLSDRPPYGSCGAIVGSSRACCRARNDADPGSAVRPPS